MEIENLDIQGGIRFTSTGPGGSIVTGNLTVQLTPNSYSGTGSIWQSTTSNSDADFYYSLSNDMTTKGLPVDNYFNTNEMTSSSGVNNFDSNATYTIELWFQPVSGNVILSKWAPQSIAGTQFREPYYFSWGGNSVLIRASNDGSYIPLEQPSVTATNVKPNKWVQVVGVFDWQTEKLYAYTNGILTDQNNQLSVQGQVQTSTAPVRIGAPNTRVTPTLPGLTGTIGIIRMYNKALSAAEVFQNFQANRLVYGI